MGYEPTYDEIMQAAPVAPSRARTSKKPPRGVNPDTGEVESVHQAGDVHPVRDKTPSGRALPAIPGLGEIEQRILAVEDELAQLTLDLYAAEDLASTSEADWKEHRDMVLVQIDASGEKGAKDTREARAKETPNAEGRMGKDLYRDYLLYAGRARSMGKHMYALQTRMSGLQTIAKGIRDSTGPYGPNGL